MNSTFMLISKARYNTACIAPSGCMIDSSYSVKLLNVISKFLKIYGFDIQTSHEIFQKHDSYYAYSNNEQERFKHILQALNQDDIDIIWCFRGGYGACTIANMLVNSNINPKHNKLLIGYSDITVLHLYMNQVLKQKSIHGPVLSDLLKLFPTKHYDSFIALENLEELVAYLSKKEINMCNYDQDIMNNDYVTQIRNQGLALQHDQRSNYEWFYSNSLIQFLYSFKKQKYDINIQPLNAIAKKVDNISANVIGGNLTILQSVIHTKLHPVTEDKILILEDVQIHPYQLHRILQHFIMSNVINIKTQAIVFGTFTFTNQEISNERYKDAVVDLINLYPVLKKIPCYVSQDFGHGKINKSLIFNHQYNIQKSNNIYTLFT